MPKERTCLLGLDYLPISSKGRRVTDENLPSDPVEDQSGGINIVVIREWTAGIASSGKVVDQSSQLAWNVRVGVLECSSCEHDPI